MEIKTKHSIGFQNGASKRMNRFKYVFLAIVFLLNIGSISAQEKKSLEKKKTQLAKDISLTRQLLKNTQNNRTISLNDLKLLQKQVQNREKMVQTVQQQLDLLAVSLSTTDLQIDSLSTVLEEIREEYAELIRHAYIFPYLRMILFPN